MTDLLNGNDFLTVDLNYIRFVCIENITDLNTLIVVGTFSRKNMY